jgi:uncharacterized protein involved in response to NO
MPRSLLVPRSHSDRPLSNALLAKGFRPFFSLAALFAVGIVPLWLLVLRGAIGTPSYIEATTFHAHEMLQGYTVAVLAGFLLTAVGNWTQRETATGASLLGLALLWVAGRAALFASGALPRFVTAAVDLSFLPALLVTLGRALFAAGSRRNYFILGIIGALWVANAAVHLEALGYLPYGSGRRANLAALHALVLAMSIMAARIFPMFTKNATGVASIRSVPMLDLATALAILLAAVLDLVVPNSALTGVMFGMAGLLAVARSAPWGMRHTRHDPLLWSLHVGHTWLAIGLVLRAAALLGVPALTSTATHALTVGAIGGLTLSMMARVSLGHTGRMLAAPAPLFLAFATVNVAAIVRCLVPLVAPSLYVSGLVVSGVLWSVAFAAFAATYVPILLQPRVDGRPG